MTLPIAKPGHTCPEAPQQCPVCTRDGVSDVVAMAPEVAGAMQGGDTHGAASLPASHVIDWVAPSLEGITSVQRPDAAWMRRIWRRWLLVCVTLGILACLLLGRMADTALLRLNTAIGIQPPKRLAVTVGPLRSLASAEHTDDRMDAWASDHLQAVAREQGTKVKQLVEQLRERRGGSEGVNGIEQSLDQGLSHVLLDLRHALATGRLGAAREAALRGGAIVEAADLDPPFTSTDLIVKVNFVLMARALLDDKHLAGNMGRLHTLAETVLHQAPDLDPRTGLPEPKDREPDAWDAYLEAKDALAQRNYLVALQRFRDCAQDRSNLWLRDLALLGEGRAHYWQARNAAGKAAPGDVLKRLRDIASELQSASLRNDIGFYLGDLQSRRP